MHKLASPTVFARYSRAVMPFLAVACALAFLVGLYQALMVSPPDYQQGESVRIMYIHVPAAWMSMFVYGVMGAGSAAYLIWRHPLGALVARESAPLGAAFTFLCMVTGALWGKPMWGAWWVWDARLTSVLVLFFLYIGYLALDAGVEHSERGRKACAWLAVIGLANLPVIRFSVDWWQTLHQPASVLRLEGPAIAPEMLTPLLLMGLAFTLFYIVLLIIRVQAALLMQKVRRAQLR